VFLTDWLVACGSPKHKLWVAFSARFPNNQCEIWTNGAPAYEGLVESGAIMPASEVLSDSGVEGFFAPKYPVENILLRPLRILAKLITQSGPR